MHCSKRILHTLNVILSLLLLAACASKQPAPEPEAAPDPAVVRAQAAEAAFQEALALQKADDLDGAVTAYEQMTTDYPEYPGPWANLGMIAFQRDDLDEAKTLFEQALEIDPEQKQVLNHLGIIAREQGRFEDAEERYRAALALDPDYAPAVRNLAILLDLYRGKFDEALGLYEHYQSLLDEPDPKVKGWIFDLKRRIQQ